MAVKAQFIAGQWLPGQRRNDEQTGPGGSVAAVAGGQRGG